MFGSQNAYVEIREIIGSQVLENVSALFLVAEDDNYILFKFW